MTPLSPPRLPASAPLQIAIDGPAGAGKSTVARQVARALGLTYIDTGAMYRALAWVVLARGVAPDDEAAVCRLAQTVAVHLETRGGDTQVYADGQDVTPFIRTPEISNLTSPLSAIPCVRARMVALQQAMAARQGVVMEGRDIGTVVLPDAPIKVFLTASLARRAERRLLELEERGTLRPLDELTREIAARDARDGGRDIAPMRPAPGAVILDSDTLTVGDVVARILQLAREVDPVSPASAARAPQERGV